jgi:hypothetical protein
MGSLTTIIIIAIILVASVAGISVIQKREQAKALLRQQIAKYRYRANETASILENFANIPIGAEARQLMLHYTKLNLSAAKKLAPTDPIIARNLSSVEQQLKAPQSNIDKQRLNIPKNVQQLNLLIKHLSRLGKYLLRFKSIKSMPSNLVPVAVNKIMLLISEAKICAYIQQGQRNLSEHNYVNAQRNFQISQQMLDKFKNKNSRLIALEKELKELINLSPSQAANKSLSIDSDESMEKQSGQEDSIFGPKKKW